MKLHCLVCSTAQAPSRRVDATEHVLCVEKLSTFASTHVVGPHLPVKSTL